MKHIIVYGPGCARCRETEVLVREVVRGAGIEAQVEKVSDFAAMAKVGVLSTPAVAVDGVVKSSGRIPRREELQAWIAG